jgi:hypothetical protein
VLQIVAHTAMLYPLDAAPGLLPAFNGWHGSHLWPTGRLDFTETAESAAPVVRLTAFRRYPLQAGVHDLLLDELLIRSLGASFEFLRAMQRVAVAGLSGEPAPGNRGPGPVAEGRLTPQVVPAAARCTKLPTRGVQ